MRAGPGAGSTEIVFKRTNGCSDGRLQSAHGHIPSSSELRFGRDRQHAGSADETGILAGLIEQRGDHRATVLLWRRLKRAGLESRR